MGHRCLTGALVTLAGLTFAGAALAAPQVSLAPSPELACLTPGAAERIAPVYPDEQLRAKESALVAATLTFTAPDREPEVRYDRPESSPQPFRDSVQHYAARLRVPCMKPGGSPVVLRQEFDFVPNDGRKVAYTAFADEADRERRKMVACLVEPRGEDADIGYPIVAQRQGIQGKVVVRLRFVHPDEPPGVTLVDDAGYRGFLDGVERYVSHLRMPCVGSEPLDVHYFFVFVLEGEARRIVTLRDMELKQFLGVVERPPANSVFFDTSRMRCPFDVRLTVRQPYEGNEAKALDEDIPERHAFVDFLAGLRLRLDAKTGKEVFGQEATIRVPCAVINL